MTKQEFFIKSIDIGDFSMVNIMINDKDINPSDRDQYSLISAVACEYFDIIELLINDSRIDASYNENYAIKYANYYNCEKRIIDLLWKNNKVREKLLLNDNDLYVSLLKNEVKNKIEGF
jgi:hypothetical protein